MSLLVSVFTNPIVAFIVLVGVVVFVHELGHYIAGRIVGVDVEEFSLGFGPKAVGFKRGPTEFKIGWLPLGGYVRFYGSEIGAEIPPERRHRALLTSGVAKRATISLAGPFANFVLSFFVMVGLSAWGMPQPAPIVSVVPGLAAERAGLRDGDKIASIAGEKVSTWSDLNRIVTASAGKPLVFGVESAGTGEAREVTVVPSDEASQSPFGDAIRVGRIGVSQYFVSPVLAVRQGSLGWNLGLRSGDEVTAVNSEPVKFGFQVENAFARAKAVPGETVTLRVKRTGSPSPIDIVITSPTETSPEGSVEFPPVHFADLTLAPLAALPKNDPREAARDAWKSCGLKEGDTLVRLGSQEAPLKQGDAGLSDGSFFTGSVLRTPVQLGAFLEKTSENAQAGSRVDIPVSAFGPGEALRTFSCSIPARESKDALGRPSRAVDFPFKFVGKGVPIEPIIVKSAGPVAAITDGALAVKEQAGTIFTGLRKLFTGGLPLSNLGGPIAIARVAGDAAEGGLILFILTISWMSVNIGMFNLLPFPALDGGSLLLNGVEAAYGRPLPVHVQAAVQKAGIVLILVLFVLVFYNDILRLFTQP